MMSQVGELATVSNRLFEISKVAGKSGILPELLMRGGPVIIDSQAGGVVSLSMVISMCS